MSQTSTWAVPSAPSGLAMRNTVNTIVDVLRSSSSGAAAPSPTVAGMFWFDESVSPAVLRIRNSSNTAWIRIIDTADAAASRSALGATAIGAQLFTSPDASFARGFLGATTTGALVFTAADAAAARAALGAQVAGSYAPLPDGSTVININAGGVNFALPSGGTWWWSYTGHTESGNAYTQGTGISAGGTVIFPGGGSSNVARGWAWRIG